MTDENKDYELALIFARYGDGKKVVEIAEEIGKSEAYVYAKMRRKPKTYEDVQKIRCESDNLRVHRVRSMADEMIQQFLEDMADDKEKTTKNIDRISRIAKDYSHRAQLIDGKATENITVAGDPFNIIITKTYEASPEDGDSEKEKSI